MAQQRACCDRKDWSARLHAAVLDGMPAAALPLRRAEAERAWAD
eukprot:gene2772-12501_t